MTGLQHWAEAYIGRPWIAGEHDCADFVVAVLREQFGLALDLPAHDPDDGTRGRATSVRAWDRQIAAMRADYAAPTDAPQDGDGVLMRARGARRIRRYHLGLWADVGGEAHVLHCQDGAGSILHPVRDLALRALELEGIYRWLPPSSSEAIGRT